MLYYFHKIALTNVLGRPTTVGGSMFCCPHIFFFFFFLLYFSTRSSTLAAAQQRFQMLGQTSKYEFNTRNFIARPLFNYVWFYDIIVIFVLVLCLTMYTCAIVICNKTLTYLLTYLRLNMINAHTWPLASLNSTGVKKSAIPVQFSTVYHIKRPDVFANRK